MGEFYGNQHTSTSEKMEYADLREAVESYAVDHGEPPTTEEAANDDRFPSLATIYKRLDGSWNDLLEDAGLERGHVGEYGPGEATEMLQDMRAVLHTVESSYLTTRQYAEKGSYADDTIKETFGSCVKRANEPISTLGRSTAADARDRTGRRLKAVRN